MRAYGYGISPIFRRVGSLGLSMAQAHYDRVTAAGGVLPIGVSGLANVIDLIASAYSVTTSAAFNTAVPVFLDPHYTGYKLGAGSGTTLGQAAQTVYAINSTADVTQATAASMPLLLAHSGVNYWFGSGVAGNYCSTPNASANQITGDIEFIAKVNFQDSGNQDTIFIKSDAVAASSYCYAFWKNGNNLALTYSNSGTVGARVTSNSSVTLSSVGYTYGTDIWVKANRSASSGNVNFYYSSDGLNWTQLGTTQSTTPQSIFNASIPLWVGDWANILFQFKGKIYRATISNSIGGTPVVDFNPASYNAATSQTQWTSTTGEVWSINVGTATTGYKGCLVDYTTMQGDGVDDIFNGTTASKQYFSMYASMNGFSSSGNVALFNGATVNTHLIFQTSSNSISANNGASLAFVGEVANRLYCATVNFNSTNSDTLYNNANKQTGNTGTKSSSGFCLFGGTGNGNSNSIFSTLIISSSVDDVTKNTAIYNIIRSMRGNAF